MKKIIKLLTLVLVLASFGANLVGCRIVLGIKEVESIKMVEPGELETEEQLGSGIGTKDAQEKEEAKLTGTLKIQVFTNESSSNAEAWTNVVTAFEEATGVKVTLLMGSQVNTQNSAAWLAGEAPADMVWIAGNGIADDEMEDSGVFYDLTELFNEETIYGTDAKLSDKVNTSVIRVKNGKIYRAPIMTSVQGMWYNQNLIDTPPTNFDELMKMSKSLDKKEIAGLTYPGIYSDYNIWALIMPAVAAYGEDFMRDVASGKPEAFLDERFKAVLNRYKEFCDAGYVLKGSTSADHTSSQLNWLNGKAGLITNGLWLETEMKDYIPKDFKMRFFASPLIEASQKPTLIKMDNSIAIAAKSKNIENAKAFVRYIYRDDIQKEFVGKYSYLSALTQLDISEVEMTDTARSTINYVNSDEVDVIDCNVSWSKLVNNTFKQAINDLTNGNTTVDKVCELLAKDAKR